jgi:hypothetical protein
MLCRQRGEATPLAGGRRYRPLASAHRRAVAPASRRRHQCRSQCQHSSAHTATPARNNARTRSLGRQRSVGQNEPAIELAKDAIPFGRAGERWLFLRLVNARRRAAIDCIEAIVRSPHCITGTLESEFSAHKAGSARQHKGVSATFADVFMVAADALQPAITIRTTGKRYRNAGTRRQSRRNTANARGLFWDRASSACPTLVLGGYNA